MKNLNVTLKINSVFQLQPVFSLKNIPLRRKDTKSHPNSSLFLGIMRVQLKKRYFV
jgi:hypothetical protein